MDQCKKKITLKYQASGQQQKSPWIKTKKQVAEWEEIFVIHMEIILMNENENNTWKITGWQKEIARMLFWKIN